MPSKVVKHSVDPAKPMKLTAKQKAEVTALRSRRDVGFEYSDIAPLPKDFLKTAIRNPFYRTVKAPTTSQRLGNL